MASDEKHFLPDGAILTAAGTTAAVSGAIIRTGHGAFIVTQECIFTPLIPLYLAAPMGRGRRAAALAATPLVFFCLGVSRLLVLAAVAILLGGLLTVQFSTINSRFDDVNARIDDLRTDLSAEIAMVRADVATVRADVGVIREDLRRFDDRLRAVEVAFGKVDQRLATLERLHLPGDDDE